MNVEPIPPLSGTPCVARFRAPPVVAGTRSRKLGHPLSNLAASREAAGQGVTPKA